MGNVAVTSIASTTVMGNKRMHTGVLHLSNSYATGGDAFTALMFGMSEVETLILNNGQLVYQADPTNKVIKALYPTGGGTASPNAIADPKVTTGGATASAVDATTPNITPGQGKEVLNGTDLSGVSVGFIATGV